MSRLEFIYNFLKDYEVGINIDDCKKLIEKEIIKAKNGYIVIDNNGRLLHYLDNENTKYLMYVGVGKKKKVA